MLGTEGAIVVTAEASTGAEAVGLAARRRPDLALVSLSLRGPDGVDAIAEMHQLAPTVRVIAFVDDDQLRWAPAAIGAGAIGAVLKSSVPSEILAVLRAGAAGTSIPALAAAPAGAGSVHHPDALSPREVEILTLLATGLSNREIAERLFIGVETVKTHVRHVLTKLNVDRRSAAVALALREGLIR